MNRSAFVPGELIELVVPTTSLYSINHAYVLTKRVELDGFCRVNVRPTGVMVLACGFPRPAFFNVDQEREDDEIIMVMASSVEPSRGLVVGYVWGDSGWVKGGRPKRWGG